MGTIRKRFRTEIVRLRYALGNARDQLRIIEIGLTSEGCDAEWAAGVAGRAVERADEALASPESGAAMPAVSGMDKRTLPAHAEATKVDEKAVSEAAVKLRRLRLTDVGGRKEHPAETVKSALKRGLGGLYDDDAVAYILRHGVRYYLDAAG